MGGIVPSSRTLVIKLKEMGLAGLWKVLKKLGKDGI
jgi:hypothetical protein